MTDITQANIDQRKRISVIWIIPIVAFALGIWMVIYTKLSEGPTIHVSFETAEGLVAGKTKVKYLNVEVGQVQQVTLNDAMDGVLAVVQLQPETKYLLSETTQFWVVRARVGAGNVSGLGTLLGGAYIELSPGTGIGPMKHSYVGLETPPLTPVGAPGIKLTLLSEEAGSVSTGDFVLYNGYKVGRVEGMGFDSQRNRVRYDLFIDAPFDQLINRSVRFWNVSGISVNASAGGVQIHTGSLDTILFGGVAFHLPDGVKAGEPVENGTEFKLYESFEAMQEQPYVYAVEYVMEFSQSLRGLLPGAPVEYRGIPIGSVKRIMATELMSKLNEQCGAPIPVLISIEPGRIELPDTESSVELIRRNILDSVPEGLRASLETGNLITGSLYINIDYYTDADPAQVGQFQQYAVIPTIQTGFDRIEEQLSAALNKINALPLEQTMDRADTMLVSLKQTLDAMHTILSDHSSRQLSAEMTATLKDLRQILAALAPEGQTFRAIQGSASQLYETLYHLDELTRTLSDKPNALIMPTNFHADPIPGGQ